MKEMQNERGRRSVPSLWWSVRQTLHLTGKEVVDNSADTKHNEYNEHDNVKHDGRPGPSFC